MSITNDPLLVAIAAALFGGIFTYLFSKVAAKSSIFIYKVTTDRVAISNQDPVFGIVEVKWQNNPVSNLFLSVIEIENASTRDFTTITLKVFTTDDVFILSGITTIVDSPNALRLSNTYSQIIQTTPGQTPTPNQVATYFHEREYICDVFNRGQKIQIQLLLSCRINQSNDNVFLDIQHQRVRLKLQKNQMSIHGVPVYTALRWGLISSLVIIVLMVNSVNSVWLISTISYAVGLGGAIGWCFIL